MRTLLWLALGVVFGVVACGALTKLKERQEEGEVEDLSRRIQDRLVSLEASSI